MFDLKTLKVLGRTTAAVDCDAILYDPATGHIFTFNGDAGSASVIDPNTGKRIANIPLPGKPEFGVTAGNGKLYVNIEDKSEVAEIDAKAMRVTRHWSDAVTGKLIATVPIGSGVDANRFDAGTQDAFASTGDGMLTVAHEDTPGKLSIVENVATMPGARTMEIDPQSHHIYTVSAKFGPAPAAVAGRTSRPPMIPGTFTLLVLER